MAKARNISAVLSAILMAEHVSSRAASCLQTTSFHLKFSDFQIKEIALFVKKFVNSQKHHEGADACLRPKQTTSDKMLNGFFGEPHHLRADVCEECSCSSLFSFSEPAGLAAALWGLPFCQLRSPLCILKLSQF